MWPRPACPRHECALGGGAGHERAGERLGPAAAAGRALELQTRVVRIEPDALKPRQWQLHTEGLDGTQHVFSGFDAVVLAIPSAQAHELLQDSEQAQALDQAH